MYEVIVGNIGKVHEGDDKSTAQEAYDEYVRQSNTNYGRAANEPVTLFVDGEPKKEYQPSCEAHLDQVSCYLCKLEGRHPDEVKRATALAPQAHEGVTEDENEEMMSWEFHPLCDEHQEGWCDRASSIMYPNSPPMIQFVHIDIPTSGR